MANKKYFWLKLKRDFFKRHDIQIIESMPNGKDYILFYMKLLLESIDHNGHLRFNETIPYDEGMLATITSTNIDVVRSAMSTFIKLKMIEILDDQTIYMAEINKMIGSEVDSAERVRLHRGKLKALQCNEVVTKSNTEIEIDKEQEKDLYFSEKEKIHPLQDMLSRTENISKLPKQLTYEEAIKLEKYDNNLVINILQRMENYAKLTETSLSVYKTVILWIENESKPNGQRYGTG